jgi:hypothetical protein
MSSTLLSGSVWGRIGKLSQSTPPAIVAVPYFGSGATELLKLSKGSLLVLKFDKEAVGSGQVDPREVVKAIKKGVEVHYCSNLHAKIYVFGKTAVVGSSNVSKNSDRHLIEACVETTDKKIVASARRFILSLLGDQVGLEYAKQMLPLYHPPMRLQIAGQDRRKRKKPIPKHSDLWLVSLVEKAWQNVDYEQEEKGRLSAKRALKNRRTSELQNFQWLGRTISRYQKGQRIIQCTKTSSGKVLVSPPSRVVKIRRYTVKGEKRAIIYLEAPKKFRRRHIDSVVRSLGSQAKRLGNPRRTKQLRNPELIYALDRLWS